MLINFDKEKREFSITFQKDEEPEFQAFMKVFVSQLVAKSQSVSYDVLTNQVEVKIEC